MSESKKIDIEELKVFLKGLIEDKKLDKAVDLNKVISEKFKLLLWDAEGVTMVGLSGEDMYEQANGYMAIEDVFEGELVEDCTDEFNLDLKLNNDCSSFNYVRLFLDNRAYLITLHSLINSNYTSDIYLNFNEIVLEDELLKNFSKGRMLGYNYNTTILKHMAEIKDSLEDEESLNYYLANRCRIKVKNESFNISCIPDYLGYDIVNCENHIEIKDYENTLFKIKKVNEAEVDLDTIEMCG